MSGFTHNFVLKIADMTTLVNGTKINLCPLAIGDIVFPSKLLMETRTPIVGPTGTPTASVGITGAVTQFTAASSIIAGATAQIAPTAAAAYVVTAATNLVLDFEAGGGNGAAATAGEIWVWVSMALIADRSTLRG